MAGKEKTVKAAGTEAAEDPIALMAAKLAENEAKMARMEARLAQMDKAAAENAANAL